MTERDTTHKDATRADYGIDAPEVVRNLIVIGLIALVFWTSTLAGLWSGIVKLPISADVSIDFTGFSRLIFVICTIMAAWMIYDSKIGKKALRDRLIESLSWTGQEQVLDVGCGRGLLLIGAAKRLTTGLAVGIDLWQNEDLSGNGPEALLHNARAEGVAERVRIETGDMRHMPFDDGQFDVIVSRAAIHNLYKENERHDALVEIVRVLRPGGTALIDDIRHIDAYAKLFKELGCQVQKSGSILVATALMLITWGNLRPGVLRVVKAS